MNERVFYMDQNADLSDLIQSMKNCKSDTTVFVLSRKSIIFESIVNLQILHTEAEKNGKNLIIITHYPKGRKMCETALIEAHPSLEHWGKKAPKDAIVAKKNTEKDFPSSIRKVPITIEENPHYTFHRPQSWKEFLTEPSWQALSLLLLFSVALFFFLSFVAFPGSTVFITPETKAIETITNLQLINAEKGNVDPDILKEDHVIGVPLESVFEKAIEFPTVSKEFQGTNANGEIVIYNAFPEEKRLRPTTRFQNNVGLVFRIEDWVIIPSSITNPNGELVPGTLKMPVVADEQDVFGEFVGERGNISPQKFFLPGLPESSQTGLWAESEEHFSGGFTDWIPRIAEVDIEAAQNKIESELLEGAEKDILRFLQEKNHEESTDLVLLLGKGFVEKEVLDLEIEKDILGTTQESFTIAAKIRVRAWAYSDSELRKLLWAHLSTKTDSSMRLAAIDINENAAELLEKNEQEGFLKISIPSRGAEEFLIDPRSEAGILFVNEIKSQITGLSKEEAEALLSNREEVSAVEISLWPFWNRRIPSLPENISIKLRNERFPSLQE